MADVDISKYRAQVVRDGFRPSNPGFVESEGQNPVDPAGSGQNHLPVTIAPVSTGLAITDAQVLGGAGTVGQYIRGDGSLADFPATTGGGSSVSYYLNGSVSQGTIGGVAYLELNKMPVFGAGTDITRNSNGYIASFITDAGDPNKLLIPAGNWNLETYFSASSNGGNPSFYVELYKYDGTTFTLLASSASAPELIAFGTNLNPYFSTLAVPQTTLTLTDRLALRYYVNTSGRTITLHTENNHLCQVITTFTTGLTALNGLTTQVQFFAVGTSGTDFNIASATDTHTFNLPTASATRRGALSSGDWSTFNAKMPAITFNSPLFIASGGEVGISQAGTSSNGFLSSTDWNTFNSKQNALTNPVTGTGTAGQVAYFTGTSAISGESNLFWDATNDRLSIGTATANSRLTVNGVDNTTIFSILAGGNSRLHVGTNASSQIFVRSQNSLSLNLGVDTTNYLTILSSGNVGINTATPATAFEVNGVGLFSGTSLAGNTKNGVYIYDQAIISLAGGNSRPLQIQSQTLSIFTGTTYTEKVRIFENGNVVISTSPTDAGFRIDVNGTGRFSGDITISKSTAPSVFLTNSSAINYRLLSADDGTFRIQRTGILDLLTMTSTGAATFSNQITSGSWINTPNTFGLTIRNAANTAFRTAVQMNSSNVLIFGQDTDITALTFGVGSEQMRITSSGNVGIGTTAPAERLAVVGAIMSTGGITGHGANRTTISQEGGGGAFWQSYGANTSTMGAFVFRQASSDFSVTNIPLSITAGGNVLIGSTTDIGYKLYVNGQSYLDGYNIASSFQFIRAATNTVNPASGNGILVFNSGNAQLRMNLSNAINFDMNNGGTPHIALQIRQNGNTVRVNSPDNGLALALAFQNTEYGYLGSTSAFSGSLLAYSVNGGYVYLSSSSTWISASDKNRKKNFENYNKGLAEICALKPTLFNLKTQNDNEPKIAGLIAQEVGEHLKEAYSDGEFVGIDYNVLTVTIINAIKELKQEIDTLKN